MALFPAPTTAPVPAIAAATIVTPDPAKAMAAAPVKSTAPAMAVAPVNAPSVPAEANAMPDVKVAAIKPFQIVTTQ
ncbi:MAG: hypothetical protein HEQ33_12310 [Dolichospermum sp. WA123]|nr:hypothetical protein [Dolichospermum sp. WA123]